MIHQTPSDYGQSVDIEKFIPGPWRQ